MKLLAVLLMLLQRKLVVAGEHLYKQDHMTCYHRVVQSFNSVYHKEMIPYAERVLSMQVAENGHYSATPCILDHTYGFYRNFVWVSHGCQANFLVCYVRGRNILMVCKSEGEHHLCRTHRTIVYMEFVKALYGSTTCIERETFGFNGEDIWVSKGCKAAFRITTPIGDNAPPFPYL
ncbi:lectin ADEL-like [Haliotis asinina]|uniref:lectin ADEL-like n=1 Tax=Haliotis asinina TaxID=109174 RepID=UPI003531B86A